MGRKNITRTILLAFTLGLFVFFSSGSMTQPWREGVLGRVAPVFGGVRRSAEGLQAWLGGAPARKLSRLEAERIQLLAELARWEDTRRENEVLREALALRREGEPGVLSATVIAFLREGRDEFLVLNRGVADGVGIGDIVVGRSRVLAGTVVAVGSRSARVILISSPSRSIDVRIPAADLRAIARGNNSRELIIELVPQNVEVKPGDRIIASPRSTGGRRSLLVGEIREVRQAENEVFKAVRAVHLFDPADDAVLVLLAP